ncbi:MAG: hypothetical protein WC551_08925 [Patescibacteria group bacterium]
MADLVLLSTKLRHLHTAEDALRKLRTTLVQEVWECKDVDEDKRLQTISWAGFPVDAVKLYRDAHGTTLREAKEYIDRLVGA